MSQKEKFTNFNRKHVINDHNITSRLKAFKFAFNLIPKNKYFNLIVIVVSTLINSTLSLLSISLIVPLIYLASNSAEFFSNYGAYLPTFISPNNFKETIIFMCLIFIVIICIKFIYVLAHNFIIDTFTINLERDLAYYILSNINKMPFIWSVNKNALVIREMALSRSSEWARGTVRSSLNILGDSLFLVMAFFGILVANFLFGIMAIFFSSLAGITIWYFLKSKIVKVAQNKIKFSRLAALAALDISSCGRELRFLGREITLLNDYYLNHKRFGFSEVLARFYKILPKEAIEVIASFVLISFILISFIFTINFQQITETLILIVILSLRALPVVSKVVTSISGLEANLPNLMELDKFIKDLKRNKIKLKKNKFHFKKWKNISLNKVTLLYEKNRGVENISFKIKRKENICLIGDTGSGKSTIIDILCGLLFPKKGNLYIDNMKLTSKNSFDWINNIIYVPQNPIMIDASIKENILWGKDDVSEEKFREILKLVCLEDFVNNLVKKENTIIGDNGKQLSGGQRQRIAIARAMLADSSLIILDESTNALDSITEKKIINNLIVNDANNRSLIFVTHRLSLIEKVDKIVFVKNGKVIDVGHHDKLIKNNQFYREMMDAKS